MSGLVAAPTSAANQHAQGTLISRMGNMRLGTGSSSMGRPILARRWGVLPTATLPPPIGQHRGIERPMQALHGEGASRSALSTGQPAAATDAAMGHSRELVPIPQMMTTGAGGGAQSAPTGKGGDMSRRAREHGLYSRAHAVGLCGPLGKRRADEWEGELNSEGRGSGATLVDQLRDGVKRRLMGNMDLGKMGTTLSWFEDFRRDTTRVPFVPPQGAGDLAAGVYNAETIELMAEYMRLRGARHNGGQISADHVQSVVGQVRTLRSLEAHYGVVLPEADIILAGILKSMRKEQGPKGERRECAPFRARHFRVILANGKRSEFTDDEWALALVAHNLLLRGGEVGRTDSKPFDAARDLTIVRIVLHEPCAESGGRPWLTVWVVSIKDVAAKFRIVPLQICARAAGDTREVCAYTALKRLLERRKAAVPACKGRCAWCRPQEGAPFTGAAPPAACQRANAPLFTKGDETEYSTEDVRRLGRRLAAAAGMPEQSVGGKLFRIGGATDMLEVIGARAESILRQRGRWATDIAFIYARASMRHVLEASAGLADADKRSIEEMEAGWIQPATYR